MDNNAEVKRLDALVRPEESLAAKVGGETPISGLAHNAARVEPGHAFFAMVGSQADGHLFVADALAKGAAVAVVEKAEAFLSHPRVVQVRSTREALALAAARWHDEPSRSFRLVGVTGTNGKTTTTYLLRSVWDALGLTSGVLGTVEYHIGAHREPSTLTTPDPLGLQSLFARIRDAGASHAVIEVSSIALDQARVGGSRFDVGIFTNLTQDHLDYHGDMESYYQAKLRFFRDYGLRVAVINADDPWGKRLLGESRAGKNLSFSLEGAAADFRLVHARYEKSGSQAVVATPEGEIALGTPLIGKHNLYNALGVLAASHALGLSLRAAAEALAVAPGAPGRLERVALEGRRPHVFVDYAHSDDALRNVLGSLGRLRSAGEARIITVFGAGGDRDRGKRPKMAAVVSSLSDVTVATSDNPRTEDPDRILDDIEAGIDRSRTRYYRERDRRRAIGLALSLAGPDDLVLVAGKGHENYQILGRDKVPFDDREVVREYFQHDRAETRPE